MPAYPVTEPPAPTEPHEGISIPLTIVAALMSGAGIFGMVYWLYTLNWIYFASVVLLIGGCYLLFTRVTGPDHA